MNSLSINPEKTKTMGVNCKIFLKSKGIFLGQVDQFKYLGLEISALRKSPVVMYEARLSAAKKAFQALTAKSRFLGISNTRVKLQLI